MREKRDVKKRCFLTYYMMAKTKIQPILPSLRERKRYLAFEIISKDKITDFNKIEEAISSASLQLFGEIGNAKAGMLFLKNKYDQIIEVHRLTGSNSDYQITILSPSIEEYDKFQQTLITEIECTNMSSHISLQTIKKNHKYPIDYV